MSKLINLLENERPREKLIKFGSENLTEVELLAIIIRVGTFKKDVLELSREIITKFDFNQISRKNFDEIIKIDGLGIAKSSQIVALFELARRFSSISNNEIKKIKIKSSKCIYNFIFSDFLHLKYERVACVFVDSKNQIIKKEIISEGNINYSIIEPRKIIKKALDLDSYGFFLIHNHPSGNFNPSREDILITKKIKKISDKLGLKMLDHLIVTDNNYFSFYDNELFENL